MFRIVVANCLLNLVLQVKFSYTNFSEILQWTLLIATLEWFSWHVQIKKKVTKIIVTEKTLSKFIFGDWETFTNFTRGFLDWNWFWFCCKVEINAYNLAPLIFSMITKSKIAKTGLRSVLVISTMPTLIVRGLQTSDDSDDSNHLLVCVESGEN